jgi:hypothetical protein
MRRITKSAFKIYRVITNDVSEKINALVSNSHMKIKLTPM